MQDSTANRSVSIRDKVSNNVDFCMIAAVSWARACYRAHVALYTLDWDDELNVELIQSLSVLCDRSCSCYERYMVNECHYSLKKMNSNRNPSLRG